MKRAIIFLGMLFGSFTIIYAQGKGRNPTPPPLPEDSALITNRQSQDSINQRSNDLKMVEKFPVKSNEAKIVWESIKPLYREPNKEEQLLLMPEKDDTNKFKEFLSRKNTGLIKLITDGGCDKNANIAVSSPHCLKYTMPGAGSSFSFRLNNYTMRHLADLSFSSGKFLASGVMTQGIFVNLGDFPLENVNLQTDGVSYLTDLKPVNNLKEAQEFAVQMTKGIKKGNFVYQNLLPAAENTTFALRSIAYDGILPRTIQGITYNEFEFDKRRDVIVAFRVVRRDSDGNINILWKQLENKKAPGLIVEQEDK